MAGGSVTPDERGYSAYGVLNVLLAHARWFVVVPVLTALLALALTFTLGRRWVAESTFAPQGESSSMGRIAALATQFGVSIPGISDSEESVDFYVRLARARVLLEEVIRREYVFASDAEGTDTVRGNLIVLYDIDEDDASKRMHQAVKLLNRRMDVAGDLNAGVVTIRTEEKWAGLSEQVNRALLDGIDHFNQQRRHNQASTERTFLENRLTQARAELAAAEGRLSDFLERNRRYDDWPALRFQHDRLRRDVEHAQNLTEALAQAYEEARLQEVRNTPVIAVLDPPEGSARRPASVLANMLWAAAAGVVLVILFAFAREYASQERHANPADYEEFAARRRGLLRINGEQPRRRA